MINRFIYDILSQDSIDDNQATKEAQLLKRFPKITDFSNLDYYWKSLKTQLGDLSDDWAQNKIKYSQEQDPLEQGTSDNSELPVIAISQQGSFEPQDNKNQLFGGSICLNIQTPIGNDSLQAFKIFTRIKEFVFPYENGIVINQACFHYPNLGINQLTLKLNRLENLYDHRLSVYLDARLQMI